MLPATRFSREHFIRTCGRWLLRSCTGRLRWAGVHISGIFSGSVYLDGSALFPEDAVLCRAGWAVVQISSDGSILQECFGNLPTLIQDSGAGELWSFLKALQFSAPPLRVVTDYKRLLGGIASGREACIAANMQHADIWRDIWAAIEDFGLEHIELVKIKSHRSLNSVIDGSAGCTWADWAGNKAADLAAKRGAAIHPVRPDLGEIITNGRTVVSGIAKWLGTLGAYLVDLDCPDVQTRTVQPAVRAHGNYVPTQNLLLVDIPAEEDIRASGGWGPRVLHCEARRAGRETRRRVAGAEPSLGQDPGTSSARRAQPADMHESHRLYETGAYIFCHTCGAHSTGRKNAGLRAVCQKPHVGSTIGCLKRLRDGCHPTTGERVGEAVPSHARR